MAQVASFAPEQSKGANDAMREKISLAEQNCLAYLQSIRMRMANAFSAWSSTVSPAKKVRFAKGSLSHNGEF